MRCDDGCTTRCAALGSTDRLIFNAHDRGGRGEGGVANEGGAQTFSLSDVTALFAIADHGQHTTHAGGVISVARDYGGEETGGLLELGEASRARPP